MVLEIWLFGFGKYWNSFGNFFKRACTNPEYSMHILFKELSSTYVFAALCLQAQYPHGQR